MSPELSTSHELLLQFGARLRQQRLVQGLPQSELAAMAGVSPGAVRILERSGQSSLGTFVRVAQALGLADELADLFALKRQSIADMERAETATRRQRAPRRPRS